MTKPIIDHPCASGNPAMDAMSKVYEESMRIQSILSGAGDCEPCGGDPGGETSKRVVDVVVDGVSVVDPETKTANIDLSGKADQASLEQHVSNKNNPHSVTKAQVGLGNVDNTSDANKPISNAQQIALNAKSNQTDLAAEATTRENADTTLQSNVDKAKVIDFKYDTATHIVTLSFGDGAVMTFLLPQSSESSDGLFSSSDYAALRDLIADVESLKSGGVWRGNFDTYEDLTAAYPNLDVSVTNWFDNDFIYVISDSQHSDNSTAYSVNAVGDVKTLIFQRTTDSPATGVPQATNTLLGIVKGSTVTGRCYVESNGELSLNGYDELAEDIENTQSDIDAHELDKTNPHATTKAQVGLGNVDNTSDADKPISTATQTALDTKTSAADVDTKISALQIGGRNLVLKSNVPYSNTNYPTARYNLSEPLVGGETYTVQIKCTPSPTENAIWLVDPTASSGVVSVVQLTGGVNGIYSDTRAVNPTTIGAGTSLYVYFTPNNPISESSIEWIKIEKGNKATDWTPAPEDKQDALVAGENITIDTSSGSPVISAVGGSSGNSNQLSYFLLGDEIPVDPIISNDKFDVYILTSNIGNQTASIRIFNKTSNDFYFRGLRFMSEGNAGFITGTIAKNNRNDIVLFPSSTQLSAIYQTECFVSDVGNSKNLLHFTASSFYNPRGIAFLFDISS